jgi:hypothetical protein
LKITAGLGISAILGETLLTSAPWLNYLQQADQTWGIPIIENENSQHEMREFIRFATLAPSGHNAQPWKFSIVGNTITIYPDYSRRLQFVDPYDRELWISLGCALENLVLTTQDSGFDYHIEYPSAQNDFISITLKKSSHSDHVPLANFILSRRNTRSVYDGRAIPNSNLQKIELLSHGNDVNFSLFNSVIDKENILGYVKSANTAQGTNPGFLNELITWLRFNKPEAMSTSDGLYTACTGNPEMPRWMGNLAVRAGYISQQDNSDTAMIQSSTGMIIISSAKDDKYHWIESGRLYERIALTLTSMGIKSSLLNQPNEIKSVRSQLQSGLKLAHPFPQMFMRYGYGPDMPRSLRRSLDDVIV